MALTEAARIARGRVTDVAQADPATLDALGAKHLACPIQSFVIDEDHRIVSTPAYMLDAPIRRVAEGVERCVQAVVSLARQPVPA